MRPAFGSGEDWNAKAFSWGELPEQLRPAFGSGEDWNPMFTAEMRAWRLRPAFGSGEDWNRFETADNPHIPALRPAFGSGEDWNYEYPTGFNGETVYRVAPGLRVGRGLERGCLM